MKKNLNEALQSNNLRFLLKNVDKRAAIGAKLFNFSGGMALDQLTDNEVFKDTPATATKWARKNSIIFYFASGDKFLGATKGKKQIMSDHGWTLNKKSTGFRGRGYRNDRLGQEIGDVDTGRKDYTQYGDRQAKYGDRPNKYKWSVITPKSFKALKENASYIYVIDLDGGNFSTKDKRNTRSTQKSGATALIKDMRKFATDNAKRYREILANKAGGKDDVDKRVGKATVHYAKLATKLSPIEHNWGDGETQTRLYVGKSSNNEIRKSNKGLVDLDGITNVLTSMMNEYRRYTEKDLEISKNEASISKETDEKRKEARSKFLEYDKNDQRERALELKKYSEAILSVTPLKG